MADDPIDLYELLSEPVLPDERASSSKWWWIAGPIVISILVVLWATRGEEPPPTSAGGAAPSSTPAGEDLGRSVDVTTPTTPPPFRYPEPRLDGSMVLDPESGSILLVGGRPEWRSDPMASVWLRHAEGEWEPVEATLEPPAREMAPMVYAESIGRVVLVGGSPDPTRGCALNTFIRPKLDVWTFDTSERAWQPVQTNGGPADRWGHGLAYDSGAERVVVFGGVGTEFAGNIANLLGDTWLFEPASGDWDLVDITDGPSPRACPGMVHDPRSGSTFLWGGRTGLGTSDATLWRFDADSPEWEEVVTEGGPDGRWVTQMVYETTTEMIFVIGGFGPQREETESGSVTSLQSSDEVWAFDSGTKMWEQRAPSPIPLSAHAAAVDGEGEIVVFIGSGTLVYDVGTDTWADVTPYELLDLDG